MKVITDTLTDELQTVVLKETEFEIQDKSYEYGFKGKLLLPCAVFDSRVILLTVQYLTVEEQNLHRNTDERNGSDCF